MLKWKIGLAAYCCLVLYASSLSLPELPDGPGIKNFDKLLHFGQYAVMGVLSWAAFGQEKKGFPGDSLPFASASGLQTNVGKIGMLALRMPGMPPLMRQGPLPGCFSVKCSGKAKGARKAAEEVWAGLRSERCRSKPMEER